MCQSGSRQLNQRVDGAAQKGRLVGRDKNPLDWMCYHLPWSVRYCGDNYFHIYQHPKIQPTAHGHWDTLVCVSVCGRCSFFTFLTSGCVSRKTTPHSRHPCLPHTFPHVFFRLPFLPPPLDSFQYCWWFDFLCSRKAVKCYSTPRCCRTLSGCCCYLWRAAIMVCVCVCVWVEGYGRRASSCPNWNIRRKWRKTRNPPLMRWQHDYGWQINEWTEQCAVWWTRRLLPADEGSPYHRPSCGLLPHRHPGWLIFAVRVGHPYDRDKHAATLLYWHLLPRARVICLCKSGSRLAQCHIVIVIACLVWVVVGGGRMR